MSTIRVFLGLLCLFSIAAHGAGDATAGQAIAATCAACHGSDGVATVPGSPNLAGQNERYLLAQLEMIKTGARAAPLMTGQLDRLSSEELANLAAYYAAMPRTVAQASDEALALGELIYRAGIDAKQVAACSACHSPSGSGNQLAGYPLLGGQKSDYVTVQLVAYRERTRNTDEAYGAAMRNIAGGLTDTEIAAVANYIQGLH